MFVNKNTKKIIFTFIIAGIIIFLPSIYFASEHGNKENIQEKKQTKYDMAKNLAKGAAQGYGTYLSAAVAHEFGHWLTAKIIHKCNGFFVVKPNGMGRTYYYYNRTNKELIEDILTKEFLNEKHTFRQPLNCPPNHHPFVIVAGPLFGIVYSLFAQRMALQSNMFFEAMGAQASLANNIANFSPFDRGDGIDIFQYFNINCPPHKLADVGFQLLTAAAAFVLAWNVNKAVLPAAI